MLRLRRHVLRSRRRNVRAVLPRLRGTTTLQKTKSRPRRKTSNRQTAAEVSLNYWPAAKRLAILFLLRGFPGSTSILLSFRAEF
jgi:hypothetical protein